MKTNNITSAEADDPVATDFCGKTAVRLRETFLTRCDAKSCLKATMFEEEPRCHAEGQPVGKSHFSTFQGAEILNMKSLKNTFISVNKRLLDALTKFGCSQ